MINLSRKPDDEQKKKVITGHIQPALLSLLIFSVVMLQPGYSAITGKYPPTDNRTIITESFSADPVYDMPSVFLHSINPEQNTAITSEQDPDRNSTWNPDSTDTNSDIKVGLVLSGGGAKGIAHIGVLEVLEEAGIRVDYISGTSMGSALGALYSLGYSSSELAELALSTDWEELFADRADRRLLSMFQKDEEELFVVSFPIGERGINLPSGLVAGQNIFSWLTQLTWPARNISDFSKLPIPYAAVATDLETGEPVVLRSGYLPDAIRASISFPSALVPYEIDGRLLLDGGLVRNLPVQEVLDMGADYVIAVDVSPPLRTSDELKTMTSILIQAVNYRVIEKVNEQQELADLMIHIDKLDDYYITDFDHSEEFIEIGRAAAHTLIDSLVSIAGRQSVPSAEPSKDGTGNNSTGSIKSSFSDNRITDDMQDPDTGILKSSVNGVETPAAEQRPVYRSGNLLEENDYVRIDRISVTGNSDVPAALLLSELETLRGQVVDVSEIDTAISHLYSSRLFALISYRVYQENSDGYHLQIRVVENTDDIFRAGARYESQTHASILLQTTFRNMIQRGSNLRMNLRLGRDTDISVDYLAITGTGSKMGINTSFRYGREQINYYSGGDIESGFTNNLFRGDLFAGTYLHDTFLAGIGLRKDMTFFSQKINSQNLHFTERDHHAFYGKFMLDTFHRRAYPVKGQKIVLRAALSDDSIYSPLNFNTQSLYWKVWHPLSESVSLQHTLYLGRSYGDELPWNYWYSVNHRDEDIGMIRFGGYDRYELTGRNIQMISAGIQVEVMRNRFLRVDMYLGNIFDEWNWTIDQNLYRTGYSLSAGILTILGPLELILSASPRNSFIYELQMGFGF